MSELAVIFVFAVLVEAIINITLSEVPVWGWVKKVAAYVVGIAVCVIWKIGVISLLGIGGGIPLADYVITGVVISRGSNYLHDLVLLLKGGTTTTTTETTTPTPPAKPSTTETTTTKAPTQ
jgi:hypothetical protein